MNPKLYSSSCISLIVAATTIFPPVLAAIAFQISVKCMILQFLKEKNNDYYIIINQDHGIWQIPGK